MPAKKKLPYNGNSVKSKAPKSYSCAKCGGPIETLRAYAALSRGKTPTYCSDGCRNAAKTARARDRKKE